MIEMQFGSHVYGTNLPTSDTDYKAIAIPSKKDIIMQRVFKTVNKSTGNEKTKNTADDVDYEVFALHYFMKLLTEGQTVCLDMIHTPKKYWSSVDSLWYDLLANKHKLLSKKMTAFSGYCQSQAAKYGLKGSNLSAYQTAIDFFQAQPVHKKIGDVDLAPLLQALSQIKLKALNGKEDDSGKLVSIPHKVTLVDEWYLQVGPKTKVPLSAKCGLAVEIFTNQFNKYGERAKLAQTNQGVDWKALMHAVRVCDEAIELCKTGTITFPRPNAEYLLKIRKGEYSYELVANEIEIGLIQLNFAIEKSVLSETPDVQFIEDFVYEVYSNAQ